MRTRRRVDCDTLRVFFGTCVCVCVCVCVLCLQGYVLRGAAIRKLTAQKGTSMDQLMSIIGRIAPRTAYGSFRPKRGIE